jgi:cytochrome c2
MSSDSPFVKTLNPARSRGTGRGSSLRPRLTFVAIVVVVVLLAQLPWADWTHTAHADAATPAGVATGLTLTFAGDGPVVDARDARLVALSVPVGGTPSPMLAPGPFVATWTGLLASPRHIKEEYRFTAEGTGQLRVTINDQPVLDLTGDLSAHPSELVTLHKGKNRLTVTYRPPPTGDARLRLLWARDDHPDYFDPVPPGVFTHDVTDEVLVQHGRVRLGRELLTSMRCAACHQGVAGTVPELSQDAPDLTDVRSRLRPQWMAAWISNPKGLRPTADMPRVFAGAGDAVDPRAADVAAYLSEGAPPELPTPPADAVALAKGARLFTGLGCVACHVAPALEDSDPTLARVPLKYVKAKFRPGALAAFLRAPEAHFAWVKMPNFHLSDAEASALSGWLLSRCKDDAVPASPPGDPARGKAAFASAGCASCHAPHDAPGKSVDLSQANWTRGCAADNASARGHGVDYGFTPEQLAALRALAAVDWKPTLDHDPPADFAARQMAAVRCTACHTMDVVEGQNSIWSNLDTEVSALEGDLPARPADDPEPTGDQSPPPLTWAGEKLRPAWAESFIAGRVAYKPRSWLFARMPSFASRSAGLAAGLADQHGCPLADDPRPPADPRLADVGRALTGQTSFGCVKCHSVGAQPAIAPFEAFAPNLAHVTDRLRHDYYQRWMRNPQVYLHGTKMPSFGNAEGKTPYKDVLGGDAAAEYGAIWQYLQAGEKIVPAP